jgi:hypothetical protein
MTAVSRVIAVIDNLTNRQITPAKAKRIVSGYLLTKGVDTTSMNNEDSCNLFLDTIRDMIKSNVMSSAVQVAQKNNRSVENTAANSALNDFN